MRLPRNAVVGFLAVAAITAAIVVLLRRTSRRGDRLDPRIRESAPPEPAPWPGPEGDGLEQLEELGLLDDMPMPASDASAAPETPVAVESAPAGDLPPGTPVEDAVGPAAEAELPTAVEPPVDVREPIAEVSEVVELEFEVADLAAASASEIGELPAAGAEATGVPEPLAEVSEVVEPGLDVAETAAAPGDTTLIELGAAGLLEDEEAPAQPPAEPAAEEAPGAAPAGEAPPAEAIEPTPAGAARAEALLDEGNAYFNVGQYALAVSRYSEAVDLDPDLVAALYNRANARTRLGEYDAALADYDAALALNPRDADALNNRGMLHLHRGDHAAALADLDTALAIDPHDTTVVVNRGLVHLQAGDPSRAFADFAEAARIDPRDAAAHYGAAQASAVLGDSVAALNSLRNAFRLDGSYVREAAADPHFAPLQQDPEFTRLLRESGR